MRDAWRAYGAGTREVVDSLLRSVLRSKPLYSLDGLYKNARETFPPECFNSSPNAPRFSRRSNESAFLPRVEFLEVLERRLDVAANVF